MSKFIIIKINICLDMMAIGIFMKTFFVLLLIGACFKCKFENYPIFRIYCSANLLLCPFKTNVFKRAVFRLYNSKLKYIVLILVVSYPVLLMFLM